LIVVDTSAVIAILTREPEEQRFKECMVDDDDPLVSAATVLEASIVLRTIKNRRVDDHELDQFVAEALRVVDVDQYQFPIARVAHLRFGRGMGHPAQLNFGDCFSYALAKSLDVPLLYKGGDFAKTDIKSAL
jgi:ribonuclease VapC